MSAARNLFSTKKKNNYCSVILDRPFSFWNRGINGKFQDEVLTKKFVDLNKKIYFFPAILHPPFLKKSGFDLDSNYEPHCTIRICRRYRQTFLCLFYKFIDNSKTINSTKQNFLAFFV